ncbi:hypothetical protein, partial [Streptomyces katsurahamanus]
MAITDKTLDEALAGARDSEEFRWVLVGTAKTEHRSGGEIKNDSEITLCEKEPSKLSDGKGRTKCKACATEEKRI